MLWAVQHEWHSGAQFTFNCYRHWATLVVSNTGDWSGNFLDSKEGMTQGDPLAMITYGIGVLPLIRELRGAHPHVTQPWYADNARAGDTFKHILAHLRDLQVRGPPRGCYPEPTKSILVVAPQNVSWVEELFRGMIIKLVTVHQYLGGFIGDSEAEKRRLAQKTRGGRSPWILSREFSASTCSPHIPDCKRRSSRSGNFCRGLTRALATPLARWRRSCGRPLCSLYLRDWGGGALERGVTRLTVDQ